jgi:rod shape determining protein RodA
MEIAGIPLRRVRRRLAEGIDGPLLAIALALTAIGLAALYSASYENAARVVAQVGNLAVALTAMWLVAQVPPQTIARLALPAYVVGLVLLVGVAAFGEVVNGARRWLNLGFGRFQPSEMMKIAMPLMLAWYFHRREGAVRVRDFVAAALLLVVPVALIARQPDLGTALLVAAAGFYVIFLAGLSWKVLAGLAVLAAAAAPPLWGMLHDYQRRRILTLLDPSTDPLGAGYHIIQATIAVGSGGITGKGWLNGSQTHLEFIPERATDFIFAVFSEEFGLIGNLVLLALYALLIARGLAITAQAPTLFTRLLAGAVTLIFFTYAFVNMGMVSGILPVVGVPLPFISYGGTALATLYIGIGILMSVHRHRKLVQT